MYVDTQYVFAPAKCTIHLFSALLDCFHHTNVSPLLKVNSHNDDPSLEDLTMT